MSKEFNKIVAAMPQPKLKRKIRWTDAELVTIRGLFAEKDEFLMVIRKALLQGELNERENTMIKGLDAEANRIIRKNYLASLDAECPLGQTASIYNQLTKLSDQIPEVAMPFIKAVDLEAKYLNQQLKVLSGEPGEPTETIVLKDLCLDKPTDGYSRDKDSRFIEMVAYTYLPKYIDAYTNELRTLANLGEDETGEQMEMRLLMNSNK